MSDVSTDNVLNFDYEEHRRVTFDTWPEHAPFTGELMAESGFYYSGQGLEVVCFSCSGTISDWTQDESIMEKHSRLFPTCDFVNGLSNNIPLVIEFDVAFDFMDDIPHIYKNELTRLISYIESWEAVHPKDLARAGFYYTGNADIVACAFCFGKIGQWKHGDVPYLIHSEKFPNCPFILGKFVGNVPYERNSNNRPIFDKLRKTKMEKLGVNIFNGPVYPSMSLTSSRLKSFSTWPKYAAHINVEDLAEAGLFYGGFNDQTYCFYCGGSLHNWQTEDDAWDEHARHFTDCLFVKFHKGFDFIENTRIAYKIRDIEKEIVEKALDSNMVNNYINEKQYTRMYCGLVILHKFKTTGFSVYNIHELENAFRDFESEISSQPKKLVVGDQIAKIDSENEKLEDRFMCKICLCNEISVVFLPCRHFISCEMCALCCKNCAYCRTPIKCVVKTFIS